MHSLVDVPIYHIYICMNSGVRQLRLAHSFLDIVSTNIGMPQR